MGSYFEGGSAANYTTGGTRFWFNKLLDDSTNPVRYEGFRDMGNVVDSELTQDKEVLEHFSVRTGSKLRDRSLVKKVSEDVLVTLDELSLYNLRNFFAAGTVTDVAATVATAAVNYEVMQLTLSEVRILGKGYNAASIVVKDITGVTTYAANTDYTVHNIVGGYKGIKLIDPAVGIANGDYVRVSYVYDVRAHKKFNPLTDNDIQGKAVFFGVSDTGNEFIREFEKVQLEREGGMKLNADDWTNFQIRCKVLDDSETNPTMPNGVFRHYGVGTDL